MGAALQRECDRMRWSQQHLLHWLRTRRVEQPALPVRFVDAFARNVEIPGLNLNTDELAAEAGARYARRARTHEGVEDGAAEHKIQDTIP